MSSQSFNAFSCFDISKFARAIDASCDNVLTCEIELSAAYFCFVPVQSLNALAILNVSNLCSVIKRPSQNVVSIGVEVQAHDLGRMPLQLSNRHALLYVSKSGSVVHAPSRQAEAVGVKGETNNFSRVSGQCVVAFSCVCIPNFSSFVEGASGYSISEGVIKSDRVHNIFVALQGKELVPCVSVSHFASSVVRSRDELIPAFVERTIGKR